VALDVHGEHLVECLVDDAGAELAQAAVEIEDADAVHQGVQAAEGVERRAYRRLVGGSGRGVPGHHGHVREIPFQCLALDLVLFQDGDPGPLRLEGVDDGPADAGPRPDHERAAALQPACHSSSTSTSGPNGWPIMAEKVCGPCQVSASSSSGQRLTHCPDFGDWISRRDPLRVSTRLTRTSANSLATSMASP